jgi:hypothetical protein
LPGKVTKPHGGPTHTRWPAVACMAQHDVWHAGQFSIMRDAYSARWNVRQP